jgi:DNA repair protein RecO (recombination protein O)
MARVERTEAVVLLSRDIAEADREVVLLTRSLGKVTATVRGARKVTSRLAGSLEPFSTTEVMLYRGARRATVTGAAHAQPYQALRTDLARYAAASVVAEAVDNLVPAGDVTSGLYALVVGGLEFLASERDLDLALTFVLERLLALLGYAPNWQACAACGRPAEDGPFALSVELGGILAGACAGRGLPLGPAALRALARLAQLRAASVHTLNLPPAVRAEMRNAVCGLVVHASERPLRSQAFYEQVLAMGATTPASTVRRDP